MNFAAEEDYLEFRLPQYNYAAGKLLTNNILNPKDRNPKPKP